ncbi:MAG: hypothetical protein LBJ32_00135 [Oscillospiraceae bacterium]|jgi:hypothetical protein|nr:hypothetical protein [Oscillospiraceae bacterium]
MPNNNFKDLNEQARQNLEIAEKHGAEQNYFFVTTFKRYIFQLKTLDELEKNIKEEGLKIERAASKNVKNEIMNPSVATYNKTCNCANKTVATIVRIITALRKNSEGGNEPDPLLEFISGRRNSID